MAQGYRNEQDEMDRRALIAEMEGRRQQPRAEDNPNNPALPPGATDAAAAAASPYEAKGPAMSLGGGFNAEKLASGHVSPKYVFAKHAQGLGVNDRDELLRRLQADESGYFKNASFGGSKGDRLMIGGELDPKFEGLREFDVIKAMGEGGKGWQWSAPGAMQSPGGPGIGYGQPQGPSTFSGIMGRLPGREAMQARLAEVLGGEENLTREALMRLIGGGQ